MKMNEKVGVVININGGTNVILPSVTSVVQNFYVDRLDGMVLSDSKPLKKTEENLSVEERNLFKYVYNIDKLYVYVERIGRCNTAHDLADVVGEMLDEGYVGTGTVVKAVFIQTLLPFATNLTTGGKVDNVRQQINNMLAAKRKKKRAEMLMRKENE